MPEPDESSAPDATDRPGGDGPPAGRVARLRSSVQDTWTRVESSRENVRSVDAAFLAVGRDQRIGGNLLACALAYRLFLWLLPVSLLIAAVLGFLDASGPGDPAEVAHDIGLGAYVTSSVADAADQASSSWWILLGLALFGLYSTSNGGAKAFRLVHALIWGAPIRKAQHAWQPPAAFLLIAAGALLMSVGADLVRSSEYRILARLFLVVVYMGYALGVELLLPHGDAPWTRLIPGAVLISVGVQLLHLATVFYLAGRVTSSSELYGALGAAATILLWLYLVGRMVVAAAVLNASLWERARAADAA